MEEPVLRKTIPGSQGTMDDIYRINVAKTRYRDAYSSGNVEQLLSVFDEKGFTDMSDGGPSLFGEEAKLALRNRSSKLFSNYVVRLSVIIIEISVLGAAAYDFGWHEFTLKHKSGGKPIRKRRRYFEVWKRNPAGDWKISLFIDNPDIREQMGERSSHWFLSEEQSESQRRT